MRIMSTYILEFRINLRKRLNRCLVADFIKLFIALKLEVKNAISILPFAIIFTISVLLHF